MRIHFDLYFDTANKSIQRLTFYIIVDLLLIKLVNSMKTFDYFSF